MVKYKTQKIEWGELITPIEAEKESDKSVWINGRRNAKMSDWEQFHDTWDDAKGYLLTRAEQKLNSARRSLEKAQGYMGNVKGLKES